MTTGEGQIPQVRPLSPEEITTMLQTRGFQDSMFQDTPIRDVWGDLVSITGEMRKSNTTNREFAVLLLNLENCDVLESTEPYTSPSAQIPIPVSNKEKSKMGYWGKSVDRVINFGIDPTLPHGAPGVNDQSFLVGKRIRLKMLPGHIVPKKNQQTQQWDDVPIECFELVEVEGMAAPVAIPAPAQVGGVAPAVAPTETVDPYSIAMDLLIGKPINQWHSEAMKHPAIKNNMDLVNAIMSGEFIQGLVGAGKIVKVGEGAAAMYQRVG